MEKIDKLTSSLYYYPVLMGVYLIICLSIEALDKEVSIYFILIALVLGFFPVLYLSWKWTQKGYDPRIRYYQKQYDDYQEMKKKLKHIKGELTN